MKEDIPVSVAWMQERDVVCCDWALKLVDLN